MTLISERPESFVTDAEVLQELLHRSIAPRAGQAGLERLSSFVHLMQGRIEPLYVADVEDAASLASRYGDASARDIVHVAVMRRLGITRLVSAERDDDRVEGVTRLDPADIEEWKGRAGV